MCVGDGGEVGRRDRHIHPSTHPLYTQNRREGKGQERGKRRGQISGLGFSPHTFMAKGERKLKRNFFKGGYSQSKKVCF